MASLKHLTDSEIEFVSSVSQEIKKARLRHGYSASFVASFIKVSLRTYQRYENGAAVPDIIDLKRLAALYNVLPYYFLILL